MSLLSRWMGILSSEEEKISSICVITNDKFYPSYVSWKEALMNSKMKEKVRIINDLSTMVKDHLMMFYKSTGGYKPHRVIMYRDGVSEGQFTKFS